MNIVPLVNKAYVQYERKKPILKILLALSHLSWRKSFKETERKTLKDLKRFKIQVSFRVQQIFIECF